MSITLPSGIDILFLDSMTCLMKCMVLGIFKDKFEKQLPPNPNEKGDDWKTTFKIKFGMYK